MMWLYETTGSYFLAVVLFALVVKLILLPFMMKSKKSTMRSTRLQPRINELQKKHGANKQKLNEEIQKLYREEGVNPMSGCIWSLIPFPILIALYQAIRNPITTMMGAKAEILGETGALTTLLNKLGYENWLSAAYTKLNAAYAQMAQTKFMSENWTAHAPEFTAISDKLRAIDYSFLGKIDLSAQPQWNLLWSEDWSNFSAWWPKLCLFLIPILAAVITYFSSQVSMKGMPQQEGAQQSMGMMKFMMPIVTVWFAFIMPAALGVYWIASMLFGVIQDLWLNAKYSKQLALEDAERTEKMRVREAELEEKRQRTEELKAQNATAVNPYTSKEKQRRAQREEQMRKAAEWERKKSGQAEEEENASSVGGRRFARGRAYDPNRFDKTEAPADTGRVEDIPVESASAPQEYDHDAPDADAADDAGFDDFYGDEEDNERE